MIFKEEEGCYDFEFSEQGLAATGFEGKGKR